MGDVWVVMFGLGGDVWLVDIRVGNVCMGISGWGVFGWGCLGQDVWLVYISW